MTYPCCQVGDITNPKSNDPTYLTDEEALEIAMASVERHKSVYLGIWYVESDMIILPKLRYIVSYQGIFEKRV